MTPPRGGATIAVAAVRSALFALLFYLGSVPIVVFAVVVSRVAPAAVVPVARFWAGWFAVTTRVVLGIRCRVTGTVPTTPVLAAFKHQAAYETIMILRLFRAPAAVMKAELTRIPLWSAAARVHGIIPVDRSESTVALRNMLRAANAAKAQHRPVVIFPEGTRTKPGDAPPLKAGLAGLYRALKLPLVPVAVDSGTCWPKGFIKYPGVVTFAVGAAIPPGRDRADMEARVHAAINALNRP
jgi:1-acyl-sn-glycerol-3-phosphate acyltransferase